jgi:hypothetical protein
MKKKYRKFLKKTKPPGPLGYAVIIRNKEMKKIIKEMKGKK